MSMGQGGQSYAAGAGPEPVVVAPGAATRWLGLGFVEFRKGPGMWIAFTLVYVVVYFVISLIPVVGSLVVLLVAPLMMGGMAIACNASAAGQPVTFDHFFAGLKTNTTQLLMVGVAYLVGSLIIGVVAVVIVLLTMGSALLTGSGGEEGAAGSFGVAMVVVLALMIPFYMALWFVVPLVAVRSVPTGAALRASFRGAQRNPGALATLTLLSFVLCFVGMIPLGLGMLVVFPLLVCAMYWSAREVFPN
jgi:uncharacterized membrane protein